MQTLSLVNRSKRVVVLHVPELGLDQHLVVTNERDRQGNIGRREMKRDLAKTITLLPGRGPGSSVDGLPLSVEQSPEVVTAIRAGELRATRVDVLEPAVAEPAPQVAPEFAAALEPTKAARRNPGGRAASTEE